MSVILCGSAGFAAFTAESERLIDRAMLRYSDDDDDDDADDDG